jgi:hypothetical protein
MSSSNGIQTCPTQKLALSTQTALWAALPEAEGGNGGLVKTLNKDTPDKDVG